MNGRMSGRSASGILLTSLVLFSIGCSRDYQAERELWKVEKSAQDVLAHPSAVDEARFDQLVRRVRDLAERFRGSQAAARAWFGLGQLYAARKNFSGSQEAFRQLIENYSDQPMLVIKAYVATAKLYEIQQKWPEAEAAYRQLFAYAPWSMDGMKVPLYVAQVKSEGDKKEPSAAYKEAVDIYKRLSQEAPQAPLELQVKRYLAVALEQSGDWREAVRILEALKQNVDGVDRAGVLFELAMLYHNRQGDPQQAANMLRTLADEFPEHPLGKAAAAQLARMNLKKSP